MPPVMGSTAFVMASFLGMPYGEIALAAAMPALAVLFRRSWCRSTPMPRGAASRACARAELPRLRATMREGWVYILVFAVLIFFMLDEHRRKRWRRSTRRRCCWSINQVLPRHRMTWARFVDFLAATGRGLAELVAILARRRLHHRRVLGDRACRHARQRPRLSRRRLAARAARHGRHHQLHLRPRADGHRLLHLPRDRAGAAAGQGRAAIRWPCISSSSTGAWCRSSRRRWRSPPSPPRRSRGAARCRIGIESMRLGSDHLLRAVLLRAESGADPAGHRPGRSCSRSRPPLLGIVLIAAGLQGYSSGAADRPDVRKAGRARLLIVARHRSSRCRRRSALAPAGLARAVS